LRADDVAERRSFNRIRVPSFASPDGTDELRQMRSAAPTLGRAALFLAALNLEIQPIHMGSCCMESTLFDDVVLLLDDSELKASTAAPLVEADHGRIETRTATVLTEIDWLQKQHQWPGLHPTDENLSVGTRPEGHRQSGANARNGGQNHDRNCLLPAQSSPFAGAAQPSGSTALGNQKQPALASGCGHKRGSGSDPNGARAAQSRPSTPHGHQRVINAGGKSRLVQNG